MKIIRLCLLLAAIIAFQGVSAQSLYAVDSLRGSAVPYPAPGSIVATPDSLVPVMISHVGRHGARFPASAKDATLVRQILKWGEQTNTLTHRGRRLLDLTDRIIDLSTGRWGVLDTLGKAEQQGIAMRTYSQFTRLFRDGRVRAISSYVPRCIMSMYEFTHQIARLDSKVTISTLSGSVNDPVMRFFSGNPAYTEWADSPEVQSTIDEYARRTLPSAEILGRFLAPGFDAPVDTARAVLAIYSVLAGTAAIELPESPLNYVTHEQWQAMWQVFNLRQYLLHSSSSLSDQPAVEAKPLLASILADFDSIIAGRDIEPVQLRFGHAETLMPLLALLQLPGCYYNGSDLDAVAAEWHDFHVVPMAANLRMILLRHRRNGRLYLRTDLNEMPVPLIARRQNLIYVPWEEAEAILRLRLF